jgi:hypothetical protein
MTINKSQTQTFEKIRTLLKQPVFTHGQLYQLYVGRKRKNKSCGTTGRTKRPPLQFPRLIPFLSTLNRFEESVLRPV